MIVVANWKAYVESIDVAKSLLAVSKKYATKEHATIVLAPPSPILGSLIGMNHTGVTFAAQDVSDATGGAATGETTAGLLSTMRVSYVIVGHSERRARGEDDALISSKVQHVLAQGLIPILCIGERERDSEAHYLAFLSSQIDAVFSILSPKEREKVIIAYEPLWAIGKSADKSITPNDLHEMALYIRKILSRYISEKASARSILLYGGSVEPSNAPSLKETNVVQGFLVGHSSADVHSFTSLLKALI